MCLLFFKEGIVKKLIKYLPVLWFVCGLAFAAASFFGYRQLLSSNDNAKQMTHQIQTKDQTKQQLESKNTVANFDPDQIKPVNATEYAYTQLHYEEITNHWGIGSLFIPSAGIQTKILAGMSNQNLIAGVGSYYPDQRLGKENYVLLAHNLVEGGGALGNLPNTKVDHVIYATDFNDIFEYMVTKSKVVDHSNGQLLDKPSKGKTPIITLFRCEGGLNTPNRALVQGKLIRSYPADEGTNEVKTGLGLGVMTEKTTPTGSTGKSSTKNQKSITNADPNEMKQFNQNRPTYSNLEKIAIKCFSIVSQFPVIVAVVFMITLIVLRILSTKYI